MQHLISYCRYPAINHERDYKRLPVQRLRLEMNVGTMTWFKSLWFGDLVYICTVAKSKGDLQAYESGHNKELYFFCEMEGHKVPLAHKIGAKNNACMLLQAADSFGRSESVTVSHCQKVQPARPQICHLHDSHHTHNHSNRVQSGGLSLTGGASKFR